MGETKFFEQMLGLSKPWRLEAVELQMEEKRVVVRLGVESGTQWAEGGGGLLLSAASQSAPLCGHF